MAAAWFVLGVVAGVCLFRLYREIVYMGDDDDGWPRR